MTLVFPTADELRAELEGTGSDDRSRDSTIRDTEWSFKFKDVSNVDPADAHGATGGW